MPPKKRNRDGEQDVPDPDQLDKDELKAMLRDSIDREANLTVQLEKQKAELVAKMDKQKKEFEEKMEEQKAELEEKMEEQKAELGAKIEEQNKGLEDRFMHRVFLHFCPRDSGNGKSNWVFYPNFRVVQQAEAARGMAGHLDLGVAGPEVGFSDSFVYHYPVETCTELVDIFENGLKAGMVLRDEHEDHISLFSVIIVTDEGNDTTIPVGEENQYQVVAARSDANRYNPLLTAHLDPNTYQPGVRANYGVLFYGDSDKYEADIQDRVRALHDKDYGTVLKGLWVTDPPDPDGTVRAHMADIDLNRMVEIAAGSSTQTDVGFW